MAKKRKAGGRLFGPRESDSAAHGNKKLRIDDWQDVADSEDEFHMNRDKILLEEGPAQKRQRKAQEEDAIFDFSDEEVFAESPEISESDPDGNEDEDNIEISQISKKSKSRKLTDDSGSDASQSPEGDEDIGEWGRTKRDYYNADAIETEADALEEENEVRRLQRKQLERLTEEDFGLDELVWVDEGKNDAACDGEGSEDGVIREILPELEITDSLTSPERLKILKTRYPEFEPLSKEFVNLQSTYHDLALAADAFPRNTPLKMDKTAQVHAMEETPPVVLKYRTLSAYLGTLSMYFVLLTSTHAEVDNKITAMPPAKLRDHSIMDTLLRCRELWDKVKDIPVLGTKDLKQASSSTLNENIAPIIDSGSPGNAINDVNNRSKKPKEKSKKPRKSKAQKALEAAQAAAAAKRLEEMENKIRTLSALEDQIRKIPKATGLQRSPSPSTDPDFGEQTILTENELHEKSQRKQSLRFYTSQITQKSQKRDVAGRHAGGDTDIPHRERLRDRQARLNAEAESRGKKGPNKKGGDALGGESDEEDRQAAAELRKANSADEDDNNYYNLIGAQQAAKKARKQAAADAAKAAEKGGPLRIQEDEFEGGKRGLSYAIAKNKGLAPRRKKEVRNPRVKKRLKFEEKKRKLGSIRAVWKGGEGKGGYKGELTGIKTGLVRGVKL